MRGEKKYISHPNLIRNLTCLFLVIAFIKLNSDSALTIKERNVYGKITTIIYKIFLLANSPRYLFNKRFHYSFDLRKENEIF